MKIGIFGGTFNPIHFGHLRAAEEVSEYLGLDKLLFIPAGTPPLKTKEIAAARHRIAMTRLAVGRNRKFRVLDIETAKPGRSYTVNTLEILLKKYKKAEISFILGIDAFLDIPNWWKPDKLISLVHFVVISRPEGRFADLTASPYIRLQKSLLQKLDRGEWISYTARLSSGMNLTMIRVTPFGISSTDIRSRIKTCKSIKYLLPETVESYIISHNLY